MPTFVNNSGSWREVSQESIFNEGVWKTTTPAIRDNGVWKQPTTPGPSPGNNPIIDVSTRNTTINPSPSNTINSTIGSPTYIATWVNSNSNEDGFGNDRGYINNSGSGSNDGWRFQSLSNNLNASSWSCYIECDYRGFNPTESQNWAFRLTDINDDDDVVTIEGDDSIGVFEIRIEYFGNSNDSEAQLSVRIPESIWNPIGPSSKRYMLLRFNGDTGLLRVDVEVVGTAPYQDSTTVQSRFIAPVQRIDNVWVGATGYKWYRLSFFDYEISDNYYNDVVKGKTDDYPTQ